MTTNEETRRPCCEHPKSDHGQERAFFYDTDSRRELCLECPGYVTDDDQPNYPRGKAWHRYREEVRGD